MGLFQSETTEVAPRALSIQTTAKRVKIHLRRRFPQVNALDGYQWHLTSEGKSSATEWQRMTEMRRTEMRRTEMRRTEMRVAMRWILRSLGDPLDLQAAAVKIRERKRGQGTVSEFDSLQT
jgi:hypothetical protein